MRNRRFAVCVFILSVLFAPLPLSNARAGAWVQDSGHWQLITSLDVSRAASGYDAQSRPDEAISFYKYYMKSLIEYGWDDRTTLFLAPEYAIAGEALPNKVPIRAHDFGIEGGARFRLTDAFGILSVQSSFKFAGPFDLSNSVGHDSAYIGEVRLLDGLGFKLFHRDGFADIEVGQRFISSPRPNETVVDLTAGVWITKNTMAMVQSFNTISGSDATPPYSYYRMHKIEASVVDHLWGRWFMQTGGYYSPAGQNSLVEQGVTTAIWARF
jgi:hypothetical protein